LVARAIAQRTPIILFDEATANLDICHQLDVLSLARDLADNGRLVICAIHDLNMAARFCDRLLLLADHQLQADDTPEKALTPETLRQHFSIEATVVQQQIIETSYLNIIPSRSRHTSS